MIGWLVTSEQRDERHQSVLLHHLVQLVLQVVVSVSFQRVLEQDPAGHQQVVQPVGDVEDDSTSRGRRELNAEQQRITVTEMSVRQRSHAEAAATRWAYPRTSGSRRRLPP